MALVNSPSWEGNLWDLAAKHYAGLFFNRTETEVSSFFNLADGQDSCDDVQANTRGHIRNIGGRVREEVQFPPRWTGCLTNLVCPASLRRRTADALLHKQQWTGTASRR